MILNFRSSNHKIGGAFVFYDNSSIAMRAKNWANIQSFTCELPAGTYLRQAVG
jgi:hypothetical protein